jgi:hypothetical protein
VLLILLIIAVVLLLTGVPNFPVGYNARSQYGLWPSGMFLIVVIVLVLLLTRVI